VQQYERLADAIAGTDDVQQLVRLGVGAFGAEHYVPDLLARLQPEANGWLVQVSVCRGQERIIRTAQGRLDLAIVTHTQEQISTVLSDAGYHRNELQVDQLAIHPLSLVSAAKTDWAKRLEALPPNRPLAISDLAMFHLVGLDDQSGIRRRLDQWADNAKKPLYFVPGTEAGGWNAAREHMRQKLGAAIIPTTMLNDDKQGKFVSRPLANELAVCDVLLRRKGESNTCCKAVRSALLKLRRELTKKDAGFTSNT
jgi:DNA-binding transcriptional LysR family regulator